MQINNEKLYYVGGFVRDEILGLQSVDIDYCYEGNAIEFAKNMQIIRTNPDFGTVRVVLDGQEVDIASTRIEIYPKSGHLPVVKTLGCTLFEDLKRRDFTINALAKNTVTGEIIDYFNGLEDIKNKKLRVLHNLSFIDDPTRIVRGLKFSVRFGFELDDTTKKLQDLYLSNINYDISYYRLKKELKETFSLNNDKAFDKFINQGIYKLLGEKQSISRIKYNIGELNLQFGSRYPYMVYLGLFDLSRFELTYEEKEIIVNFERIKSSMPEDNISTYNLFNKVPLESILLYAISVNYEVAINYLTNLAKVEIATKGDDLLKLGIKQGPIYKEIFDYLLACKLENSSLTKDDEISMVKRRFGL